MRYLPGSAAGARYPEFEMESIFLRLRDEESPFQHRQSMRHSLYLGRYSVNSCHPVPGFTVGVIPEWPAACCVGRFA